MLKVDYSFNTNHSQLKYLLMFDVELCCVTFWTNILGGAAEKYCPLF